MLLISHCNVCFVVSCLLIVIVVISSAGGCHTPARRFCSTAPVKQKHSCMRASFSHLVASLFPDSFVSCFILPGLFLAFFCFFLPVSCFFFCVFLASCLVFLLFTVSVVVFFFAFLFPSVVSLLFCFLFFLSCLVLLAFCFLPLVSCLVLVFVDFYRYFLFYFPSLFLDTRRGSRSCLTRT